MWSKLRITHGAKGGADSLERHSRLFDLLRSTSDGQTRAVLTCETRVPRFHALWVAGTCSKQDVRLRILKTDDGRTRFWAQHWTWIQRMCVLTMPLARLSCCPVDGLDEERASLEVTRTSRTSGAGGLTLGKFSGSPHAL